MGEQTERANPHCKACGTRVSFSCGEIGPGCGAVIEPDWADLREMARNAGWRCRNEPVGLRPVETKVWAHYPPGDRYPDGIRGWARVASGRGGACRISVEMHAPGRDPRSRVDLVDPTPAQVLNAARLIGLVGAP
jgi:hypothetical protein